MSLEPLPRYRRAHIFDIPAMSAIRLSVTENVLSHPERVTRQMYIDYLEETGRGWVAEVAGRVVAFCYVDSKDGSVWALFVAPGHEGKGLARHLLALGVDYLCSLGHDTVRLSTAAHTRADRFYAAQGWTREWLDTHEVGYTLRNPRAVALSASPV